MQAATEQARSRLTPDAYGASWPTPFSFTHSFIRYAGEVGLTVENTHWDIDSAGKGLAAYRAVLDGQIFSWVVASHMLDPDAHQDRIIATQWDATSTLVEGDARSEDFTDVYEEVPNVLWGRARKRTLVWSRANRSVRLFAHVVNELALGRQPNPDRVASIGYLIRTTGFSANGRNGMVDYADLVANQHSLRGAYHAQMLAAYIWREFSVDLANHLARAISPSAATIHPAIHEYLGVGNSSGIGLAPFVVRHPVLVNHWATQGKLALERVWHQSLSDQVDDGPETFATALLGGIETAINHFRQQPAGAYEHFTPGPVIAADLRLAQEQIRGLSRCDAPVSDLLSKLAVRISAESIEAIKSIVLDVTLTGREQSRIEAMTADETLHFDGRGQCESLLTLLRTHFKWAFESRAATWSDDYYFWYNSEEHAEPRRGEPGVDLGEEYGIPLDVVGRLQQLDAALVAVPPQTSIAQFALDHPDLRYMIAWVQTMGSRPETLIPTDFMSRDFLPLDVMRFQLAIYGMLKMRPTSRNWLRGTILQGAPLAPDLSTKRMPLFPVAPRVEVER